MERDRENGGRERERRERMEREREGKKRKCGLFIALHSTPIGYSK